MQKITFQDLPSTSTPINATNLNAIQNNTETAINSVSTNLSNYINGTTAMQNINVSGRAIAGAFGKSYPITTANATTTIETGGNGGLLFLYNTWGTCGLYLLNRVYNGPQTNTINVITLVSASNVTIQSSDATHINIICGQIQVYPVYLSFHY